MRILCSTNIPYAAEAFQLLGDVEILPPDQFTPDRVRDADALVRFFEEGWALDYARQRAAAPVARRILDAWLERRTP